MEERILYMAEKLGLTEAVKSALVSGQDPDAVADVIFALFCEMLKTSKDQLTRTLALDKDVPHASKLLGIEAIKRDVNYLWD